MDEKPVLDSLDSFYFQACNSLMGGTPSDFLAYQKLFKLDDEETADLVFIVGEIGDS